MFEKKIKKFFNSVSVCGEGPLGKRKTDKRLYAIIGISACTICAALGAGLAIYLTDKGAKAAPVEG